MATDRGHRRHLSNYLLDRKLQLRYIAVVTLVSAALMGLLGFLLWNQEAEATRSIVRTLEQSDLAQDPELKAAVMDKLAGDDSRRVVTLLAVGVGMVVVLVAYLVVMTHKVAGPLYKVSKYFDEMAEGRLGEVYPLRRGDQLKGFYDAFKEMHDAVRDRQRSEIAALRRLVDACAAAGVSDAGEFGHALAEARAYCDRREALLGGAAAG